MANPITRDSLRHKARHKIQTNQCLVCTFTFIFHIVQSLSQCSSWTLSHLGLFLYLLNFYYSYYVFTYLFSTIRFTLAMKYKEYFWTHLSICAQNYKVAEVKLELDELYHGIYIFTHNHQVFGTLLLLNTFTIS